MPFFQNPFPEEFRGSLPFGDKQYSLTFKVPANKNQNQAMIAWNFEPYDLSTYNSLIINYAIDSEFKNYVTLTINIAGATPSATLASEIATILNANTEFSDRFVASVVGSDTGATSQKRLFIKAIKDRQAIRAYITNTNAERILKFNQNAGVAELPTYYARHTIANRFTYTDGLGALIQLDESNAVDQAIITAAGFVYGSMLADWQLLDGRVGIFNFQKITVDGSDRITLIIEYPAGAGVGDMARKIAYSYTGGNTNPDKITEIPYTLTSGDLVTP